MFMPPESPQVPAVLPTPLDTFSDPDAVARYADMPPRCVPGFDALHRMTQILLAEHAPPDARILVLGAGGGLELKAFAEARPGWTFDGVDPSAEMLALAERVLGPLSPRARLHRGTIEDAPEGPFDAGTCLLTLHFLAPAERSRTLSGIRRRLKPGAPFVAAHSCMPRQDRGEAGDVTDGGDGRALWLSRYAAFAIASGVDPEKAEGMRAAIDAHLHLLSPAEDEAILRDAGFAKVEPFYAAFTWRGWLARA